MLEAPVNIFHCPWATLAVTPVSSLCTKPELSSWVPRVASYLKYTHKFAKVLNFPSSFLASLVYDFFYSEDLKLCF